MKDYKQMLLDRARERQECEPAPLSWLDYKNQQNLAKWQERRARESGNARVLGAMMAQKHKSPGVTRGSCGLTLCGCSLAVVDTAGESSPKSMPPASINPQGANSVTAGYRNTGIKPRELVRKGNLGSLLLLSLSWGGRGGFTPGI